MSYKYIIDSYAWIEYFRGTSLGEKARPYVESREAATATITISELREKYLKESWNYFNEDLNFITSTALVVPLEKAVAISAGEINHAMKRAIKGWGISDSIILATARLSSARVVTGDEHFKGLKETIFLKNKII